MQVNAESSNMFECYAECSLPYAKVLQVNAESSNIFECYAECSSPYTKVVYLIQNTCPHDDSLSKNNIVMESLNILITFASK